MVTRATFCTPGEAIAAQSENFRRRRRMTVLESLDEGCRSLTPHSSKQQLLRKNVTSLDHRLARGSAATERRRQSASLDRISVPMSRCILRASVEPIDLDRYTARGGPRFDQFERPVPTNVRE